MYLLSSCSDSSLTKVSPCSEAGKPCNPCLDAAKACNLNETCKRLRSAYNSICSKAVPPQSSLANQEPCSRKRCQKVSAKLKSFNFFIWAFVSLHFTVLLTCLRPTSYSKCYCRCWELNQFYLSGIFLCSTLALPPSSLWILPTGGE